MSVAGGGHEQAGSLAQWLTHCPRGSAISVPVRLGSVPACLSPGALLRLPPRPLSCQSLPRPGLTSVAGAGGQRAGVCRHGDRRWVTASAPFLQPEK